MNTKVSEKTAYYATLLIAVVYFAWWGINYFLASPGDKSLEWYSDSYWLVAVVGVICGLLVAKQWGGLKSVFGRALLLFTFGLAAQLFGQVTYSYYALVKHIEAPYPSIGDIGFFGSILFYTAGVFVLSKAIGVRFKAAPAHEKLVAIAIPAVLLLSSWALFLKDYEFEGMPALTIFLDFGYPLGQATYISLALLAYILSRRSLGGTMKNKVLLILFALFVQYVADFLFLYRFSREQWYAGDVSDLLYQAAYLFMTLALLQIGSVARKLRAKS